MSFYTLSLNVANSRTKNKSFKKQEIARKTATQTVTQTSHTKHKTIIAKNIIIYISSPNIFPKPDLEMSSTFCFIKIDREQREVIEKALDGKGTFCCSCDWCAGV
jgi:hypothetical protein